MVGVAGFELATPCTPCKCATRLRYTPTKLTLWHEIEVVPGVWAENIDGGFGRVSSHNAGVRSKT